jgi:hypothetical protein
MLLWDCATAASTKKNGYFKVTIRTINPELLEKKNDRWQDETCLYLSDFDYDLETNIRR